MHTALLHLRSIVFLALILPGTPLLASENTLLVFGDSLSAAYGVPSEQAWVPLLRQRLAASGYDQWQVVNASISGETTDGGLRRLPALLKAHQPDIVILELGGNDGLRGFPPSVIRQNLTTMIERTENAGATPILVGMQIPPNYGKRYTSLFAEIYPQLAERYQIPLVPFFLEGIYNREGLMQDDGIHPTAEAQIRLLDNVWPVLEPVLASKSISR